MEISWASRCTYGGCHSGSKAVLRKCFLDAFWDDAGSVDGVSVWSGNGFWEHHGLSCKPPPCCTKVRKAFPFPGRDDLRHLHVQHRLNKAPSSVKELSADTHTVAWIKQPLSLVYLLQNWLKYLIFGVRRYKKAFVLFCHVSMNHYFLNRRRN